MAGAFRANQNFDLFSGTGYHDIQYFPLFTLTRQNLCLKTLIRQVNKQKEKNIVILQRI